MPDFAHSLRIAAIQHRPHIDTAPESMSEEWHDCSKVQPPDGGHIVTGNRRPDGSWRITGIHPPGTGRERNMPGTFWAQLPEWVTRGPIE